MAYDLEEQEQLASLKAFWKQWGNLLTWVLIIALGGYAAYNYWNYYQRKQSAEASALYDQLAKQAGSDNAKAQRMATDIQSKYGSTTYADLAALVAAKSAFDANDLKTAKAQLQRVIEKGSDELKSVAKLRLAAVLLDEKAYDEGLKLLGGEFLPQFAAEVADRKGDILVAQNKLAEARTAYEQAFKAMEKRNPARQLVQVKLEAIGGTVPEADKANGEAAA
jgi:predicted negative regulator of RcsB-dependent stress response